MYSQIYFNTSSFLPQQSKSLNTVAVDSLINSSLKQNEYLAAIDIAHNHAVHLYKKKAYTKAIHYALIEIDIYNKIKLVNKKYIDALYNIAKSYSKLRSHDNAQKYYQKIIDLNSEANLPKTALSYAAIGAHYVSLSDYYKAIHYYQKSTFILEHLNKPKWLFNRYLNLANVYERINTHEALQSKINILNRALLLSEKISLSRYDYYSLYNAFASYYNNPETFDFKKSKAYQFKYLNIALAHKDSSAISVAYSNLGNLYNEIKNDSALSFLEKSLAYSPSKSLKAKTHNFIAEYYLLKKQFLKTLQHTERSLSLNTSLDSLVTKSLSEQQLLKLDDKFSTLFSLNIKTTALIKLYQQQHNISFIKKALHHLKVADYLIDMLLNESSDEQSKLFWQSKAPSIYSKATLCAQLMNNPDLAFYFIEKNKAVLLTQSILENAEKAKLPSSLLSKEQQLKHKILRLENQINKEKNTTTKELFTNDLFDLKLTYRQFNDSLQLSFPEYFKYKSKSTLFSLANVQSQLANNNVVLSYIWNIDKNPTSFNALYGILITSKETVLFEIPETKEIEQLIAQYHRLISAPFETQSDIDMFTHISYQLYTLLFPDQIQSKILNNHITIIPDGYLQSIPFESLLTQPISEHYLIKESMISYAYSMSFLRHNATLNRSSTNDFIGFAPEIFKYDNLTSLSSSRDEVSAIQKIFTGQTFLQDQSTSVNFRNNSNNASIIHLATHANVSQNPWIAFYDTKLNLQDLYTIPNQAELVVLSACNSSLGTTINGEGIFSLVRGFFYSGTNAVIASLWDVNDKTTAALMTDFYANLKLGKSRVSSLHKAKINYLKTHSLSEASPYYWASFVLIGQHDKIHTSSSPLTNTYISILFVLILLLLFIFRKKTFFLG